MATVTITTYKVLSPEESEQRRRRVSAIIRDIEYKLALEEEREGLQQAQKDE